MNNCDYYILGRLKMKWKGFLKFEKMTFLVKKYLNWGVW